MSNRLVLLFCLVFVLEGLVFIPYVGLQNDEMLFTSPLYAPQTVQYSIRAFHHQVPAMLMTYLGTLKGWIYGPLFAVWPPSAWSVRIPVLVLGAVTIWFFFRLVRNAVGPLTAVIAAALLATDVTFILTTCLDWGPVALQHFLLITGLLLLWRFHRDGRLLLLGAGFFLFGLALWDKALFAWPFVGLLAATIAVFPRALFSKLTLRNLAVATIAFLIGAAPLVGYNLAAPRFSTFRSNAQVSAAGFPDKALMLRRSLEGNALMGPALHDYPIRDEAPVQSVEPANAFERFSVELSEAAGLRTGFLPVACLLALAALPWLWRTPARKPMLFSLIFAGVTWFQMAFTKGAGTGQHHAVLLWPFPHLFVAAALAQASLLFHRKRLIVVVLAAAIICGANILVLNYNFARLIESGTTVIWTDAIGTLSAYLGSRPARQFYVMDWGIFYPVQALNQGRLPAECGWAPLEGDFNDTNRKSTLGMIMSKGAVFVDHVSANEYMVLVRSRLDTLAQTAGMRKQIEATISDRNSRPIFEVFRFVAGGAEHPAGHS